MSVPATSVFTENEDRTAALIAATAAWQAWTGAATAADAAKHVYFHEIPAPGDGRAYTATELQNLRPLALVGADHADPIAFNKIAEGEAIMHNVRGQMAVQVVDQLAAGTDPGDPERAFLNNLGELILGMTQLAGQDDGAGDVYLPIREVQVLGWGRGTLDVEQAQGEHHIADLTLVWGP